jgi:hypothetical protein
LLKALSDLRLPDGQITSTFPLLSASTPSRKNIPLRDYPKSAIQPARSIPPEGRIAIVTDVGVECGGRGSVARADVSQGGSFNRLRERDQRAGRATLLRTAKPCGPDTRCWCQVRWRFFVQPYRARQTINPRATVTRRIRRRGERGVSRKTIAQGKPDCLRWTCMLVCAFFCANCTRDRGCSAHPAFPAPSSI